MQEVNEQNPPCSDYKVPQEGQAIQVGMPFIDSLDSPSFSSRFPRNLASAPARQLVNLCVHRSAEIPNHNRDCKGEHAGKVTFARHPLRAPRDYRLGAKQGVPEIVQ